MVRRRSQWPSVDELVICTVKKVFPQGAFLTLDEYGDKEGMVHISEVASGWIRNIRDHVRENQKAVCRVLDVDSDRKKADLSIRRVKDGERRWKAQRIKLEQRAEKLLEIAAGKLGKSLDQAYEEAGFALQEKFGDIYLALESAAKSKDGIAGIVDDSWAQVLNEVAAEKWKLMLSLGWTSNPKRIFKCSSFGSFINSVLPFIDGNPESLRPKGFAAMRP